MSERVLEAIGAAAARFPCPTRPYAASRILDTTQIRRRCKDSTLPWRAVAHYWGEGGNESRQQARVSKVRTDPIFPPREISFLLATVGINSSLAPSCLIVSRSR